jgi:hypothetical protein
MFVVLRNRRKQSDFVQDQFWLRISRWSSMGTLLLKQLLIRLCQFRMLSSKRANNAWHIHQDSTCSLSNTTSKKTMPSISSLISTITFAYKRKISFSLFSPSLFSDGRKFFALWKESQTHKSCHIGHRTLSCFDRVSERSTITKIKRQSACTIHALAAMPVAFDNGVLMFVKQWAWWLVNVSVDRFSDNKQDR